MDNLVSFAIIVYFSIFIISFPLYIEEILEIIPQKYKLIGILLIPLAPIILILQGILIGIPMFVGEVLFDKSTENPLFFDEYNSSHLADFRHGNQGK
ncbi:MAG: hypothetical protein ACPLRU_00035 [Desulfofundulus sp.]